MREILLLESSISTILLHNLRMFAGYNYLFKLFFLHLFFASKIYNKTFNIKIAIGQCAFFSRYRLLNGPPI